MKYIFILIFTFTLTIAQDNTSFNDNFDSEFGVERTQTSFDPLKPYNIVMTKFNDFVYINVLSNISRGYNYVVARPIREGVSNFFDNLLFPVRFVNNVLQFKFQNAAEESGRFIINSTFGLAGFIDIAKKDANLTAHNEDFGQTLGFYGVGNGIHIVLPFLGPSNLRDTIGLVADLIVNPINYAHNQGYDTIKDNDAYILIQAYKIVNEYSLHVREYESIRKDSVNLYMLLKNGYEQRRDALIQE